MRAHAPPGSGSRGRAGGPSATVLLHPHHAHRSSMHRCGHVCRPKTHAPVGTQAGVGGWHTSAAWHSRMSGSASWMQQEHEHGALQSHCLMAVARAAAAAAVWLILSCPYPRHLILHIVADPLRRSVAVLVRASIICFNGPGLVTDTGGRLRCHPDAPEAPGSCPRGEDPACALARI